MNFYDSERMVHTLLPLGYTLTQDIEEADAVIVNTCHIREKAEQKMYSELGRIHLVQKRRQAKGQNLLIMVAGCVAQAQGDAILEQAPYVNLVVGPQAYHRLPEYVARLHRTAGVVLDTDFPVESKFDHLPEHNTSSASAFLSIQEGCDKFCHFCVVPYTRGAEYSRPVESIVHEAKVLLAQGVVEITLLGQNVNAYHGIGLDGQTWDLGQLLFCLAELSGLSRLRYTTSHPRDMHPTLLAAHRDLPNVMPFLHLPVQSGSDRMLKAMNRKHTIHEYKSILQEYRAHCPHIAFSSDFIVGYPGEREEDHQATLDLIDAIRFSQAYSFIYSPRPGTPAASIAGQVPCEVQQRRLSEVQDRVHQHQTAFNQGFVGKVVTALIHGPGRRPGQIIGKSPWMQSVVTQGCIAKEKDHLIDVHITHAGPNSMGGERLTTQVA